MKLGLILKTGFLLLIAVLGSFFLAFLWMRSFMFGLAAESLRVEADLLTHTFQSNLLYVPDLENLERLSGAVDYISAAPAISSIIVVDTDNRVRVLSRFVDRETLTRRSRNSLLDMAVTQGLDEGEFMVKLNVSAIAGDMGPAYRELRHIGAYLHSLDKATLDIAFPIFKDSRRLGYVEIRMSLREWSEYLSVLQVQLLLPLGLWGAIMIVLGLIFITISVLRPIGRITEATRQIADGNLKRRIDIQSYDEIGVLASSINTMTKNLERNQHDLKRVNEGLVSLSQELEIKNSQLRQKQAELDFQLRLAQSVQKHILPRCCPEPPGLGFAVASVPAGEIGGDMYDFIELADGKLVVIVGDVSGKGLPAALIQSMAAAVFRQIVHSSRNVREILERANELIFEKFAEEHSAYLTVFIMIIDPRGGHVQYARAGHVPPFILRDGQEVVTLQGGGFGVGMFEKGEFEAKRLQLRHGDRMVMITDGVIDARNRQDETFGHERLVELVKANSGLDAQALVQRIMQEVQSFVRPEDRDDCTILVMDYSVPPPDADEPGAPEGA